LWNKQVEAWFPGGKDDADLALLRVDIDNAELWETYISVSGRMKMLFGDTIKSGEAGSHAVVQPPPRSATHNRAIRLKKGRAGSPRGPF
jgi:hypothetical protein